MLNAKIFANALTTVALLAYLICAAFAFLVPELFFRIAGSLSHAINIQAVQATEAMPITTFLGGVAILGIYIWVLSFMTISLYNKWVNKDKKV